MYAKEQKYRRTWQKKYKKNNISTDKGVIRIAKVRNEIV